MKNLEIVKLAWRSNKFICLIVIILITLLINGGVKYNRREVKTDNVDLSVIVIDEDSSQESEFVLARFRENKEVQVRESDDYDRALKDLLRQKVDAIFIFKEGFGEDLLAGRMKERISLQYAKGNIAAEMIGEILGREVFRIYTAERVLDDINKQYQRAGEEFTPQMRQEASEYTESFWDEGMTIEMDISAVDGVRLSGGDRSNPFKNLIVYVLVCMGVLMLVFTFANELIRQRKVGIFQQLKVQKVSYVRYASIYILAKIILVIGVLFLISTILGLMSTREIASYIGLIGVGAVITIGLGRLSSGRLLFSLIPLLAMIGALSSGYLLL